MKFTDSLDHELHVPTGFTYHEDSKALPTVVSDKDMNSITWELMTFLRKGNIAPLAFDKDTPTSYEQVYGVVKAMVDNVNTKATNAINNANNRVLRTGDTMTGKLFIEGNMSGAHSSAGIALNNKGGGSGTAVHFDGWLHNVNNGGMHILDSGGGGCDIHLLHTPNGDPNIDRRTTHTMLAVNGQMWNKSYGWLHDFFAKQSDNNNIWASLNNAWNTINGQLARKDSMSLSWYPNHYKGCCIFKFRDNGLMIAVMEADIVASGSEIFLPEMYTGFWRAFAIDSAGGNHQVSCGPVSQNSMKVHKSVNTTTETSIFAVGHNAW